MGQAEWSIPINVTGAGVFKPGDSIDRFTPGVHSGPILSATREESRSGGGDNILFVVEAADGPDKGKKGRIYMPVDPTQSKNPEISTKHWKNLLLTVVKNPANLERGVATLTPNHFVGKPVYFFVQDKEGKDEKGRPLLQNLTFVPPDMAKELKASPTTAKTNGTFKVDAGAIAPQPTSAAAPLLD